MLDVALLKQPPLTTVIFKGELAAKFGECHVIRGYSVQELVAGIACNHPDLKAYLLHGGRYYRTFCGNRQIGEDELAQPTGGEAIIIEPVPSGAGGGWGRIVGGIALIALGVFTGGGSTLILAGAASVAAGAAELLSPQPKTPKSNSEKESSFLFDSLGGASRDDAPIPLPYGEGPVAGIVLSQAITTSDIAI